MTFKHEKRIPPVVWAVIADRSQARFLTAAWPDPKKWEETSQLVYEEGTLSQSEVVTDRPGTFAERFGGHHGGQEETDFKHQSAERFVSEIIDRLESGRTKQEFGKLVISAPPLFLGVLRKKMPAPLKQMVVLEMNQDYTHTKLKEISKHLQSELAATTDK